MNVDNIILLFILSLLWSIYLLFLLLIMPLKLALLIFIFGLMSQYLWCSILKIRGEEYG